LHKLKFYPSVLLLMIKMNQSAREKLDSYCKKKIYARRLNEAHKG